jgi:hypothetical protein
MGVGKHNKLGEGNHNRLGKGKRKVRLGQDSLPNRETPRRNIVVT